MAVGPETQVHEIEHDRSAGDLPPRRRVLLSRHLDVCGLHGHRMDLLGTQRTMREQALSHVSEIPLRVSVRRHSLVDLDDLQIGPTAPADRPAPATSSTGYARR